MAMFNCDNILKRFGDSKLKTGTLIIIEKLNFAFDDLDFIER
jgi:hypothetical protein